MPMSIEIAVPVLVPNPVMVGSSDLELTRPKSLVTQADPSVPTAGKPARGAKAAAKPKSKSKAKVPSDILQLLGHVGALSAAENAMEEESGDTGKPRSRAFAKAKAKSKAASKKNITAHLLR